MEKKLNDEITKLYGSFTEELVNGWHKKDLDDIVPYTESCFRSIFSSLEEKGFFFDGLKETCPKDFYDMITKPNGGGLKDFEISKNSFFGVMFESHYIDPNDRNAIPVQLKRPLMFLPFTNEYGDVYVRNSLYSLQYVLSERGPSVDGTTNKTIFIRVLGFKTKIMVELHRYYKVFYSEKTGDISRHPQAVKFPASRFFNSRNDRKVNEKKTPLPLLAWYLFGKYGFDYAMKNFAECEYVIGYEEELIKKCPSSEGWEIFINSAEINQKHIGIPVPSMKEPGIAIKQRVQHEVGTLAFQYAGALLYMFAVFTSHLDLSALDDINYWRLLIAYCSIKLPANQPDEAYLRQMPEHFVTIESYAESHTLERYNKTGIPVKDTYELLNYLIVNYSNIIRTYNPADLLHKELACKEFLLENIIRSANEFKFRIRNKSNITPKIINRELDFHFKLFGIDKSIRENNSILEQTGTDNPFVDYGLGIIRQTKSTISRGPSGKKDEFDPNHPGSQIDASQPFVVSYQYATHKSPEGNGFLQPRVYLREGKYTAIREEDRELYNKTKKRLRGIE